MENTEKTETAGRIVALSNIGKVRKNNEDATFGCVSKYGTLLLVADGRGGHRKGDVASKMVRDILGERRGRGLTGGFIGCRFPARNIPRGERLPLLH